MKIDWSKVESTSSIDTYQAWVTALVSPLMEIVQANIKSLNYNVVSGIIIIVE